MFQLENCIVAKIQGLYIRVEKMWNIFQSSFSAVDRLVVAAALGGTHPQHCGQETEEEEGRNAFHTHLCKRRHTRVRFRMLNEISSSILKQINLIYYPRSQLLRKNIVKDKQQVQAVMSQGHGDVHSCAGVEEWTSPPPRSQRRNGRPHALET